MRNKIFGIALISLVFGCLIASANIANAQSAAPADTIYFGGPILTMNDAQPSAEALAIKDGKILAVGARTTIEEAHKGSSTQVTDLGGRTLMPGFIDSHSHLLLAALKQATVNMDPPPAGDASSIEIIKQRFVDALKAGSSLAGGWLIGWGYNHAFLDEARHPTRDDLDAVSTDVPIILMHYSTHQLVANSKALELSGITAKSEPPEGGHILRRPDSREPNGIIEETAMLPILHALSDAVGSKRDEFSEDHLHAQPDVAPDDMLPMLFESSLQTYVSAGFTTVSDFMMTPAHATMLQKMGDEGRLPVDVLAAIGYISLTPDKIGELFSPTYKNRFRIVGGKINLDGGTPGRTAFLRKPYHVQQPGEDNYRGYSSIEKQDDLNDLIASYFAINVPIHIHTIGDAAVDQAIAALKYAKAKYPGDDRRTQLIHMQLVQEDQFEALKKLDVTMTFQSAHAYYLTDFHAAEILGPERTKRLLPMQSAIRHGFSTTIHHDAPVHPVDQFTLISAVVNRTGLSGKVWGPDERVSVLDALKASTINAAYQFHEEKSKGSLEKGKLADLVILDQNPMTIDPTKLMSLKVLETIKEGKSVFRASSN